MPSSQVMLNSQATPSTEPGHHMEVHQQVILTQGSHPRRVLGRVLLVRVVSRNLLRRSKISRMPPTVRFPSLFFSCTF